MNAHELRALTGQLADDLGWLEGHCRRQPDLAPQAGQLRLSAALVRNVLGPYLDGQPTSPLHVAVVGGAGAGKSTVVNFLVGQAVAEANPQAGFTRHPVAYAAGTGPTGWSSPNGFLGPLRRLPQPAASNLDEDVYQVRRVATDGPGYSLLKDFVVWDCPDMTTWAATGYVPRLIEVSALADVIVYVASDERYNDEIPTQFLRLLVQAGKPVVTVLTKMREADAPAIVEHFRKEVLARVGGERAACLAVPFLTAEALKDPTGPDARKYRTDLLNQVMTFGLPASEGRKRAVRTANDFFAAAGDHLLSVARQDLEALESWAVAVNAGRNDFDARYRREYLGTERFRQFDEALVKLLDLLEVRGVGKLLSGALYVVRTPGRLLFGYLGKALARPEGIQLPERDVLEKARAAWLDQLRTEALRRSGSHPIWLHIARGFDEGLSAEARDKFELGLRGFQLGEADEVERISRSIYAELEKNPAMLTTLRGLKLGLDAASVSVGVVGIVAAGGLNIWDWALVPLAASVSQGLVERLGKTYVDQQRELAREQQQQLVGKYISGPLAEYLTQWPASGGSSFEHLQQVLRRIPVAIRQLDAAVQRKLAEPVAEAKV
jgi:GTP-binding protein EngB required for normal cell division